MNILKISFLQTCNGNPATVVVYLINGKQSFLGSKSWIFVVVKHVFLCAELVKVMVVSSHLELLHMTENLARASFCNIT